MSEWSGDCRVENISRTQSGAAKLSIRRLPEDQGETWQLTGSLDVGALEVITGSIYFHLGLWAGIPPWPFFYLAVPGRERRCFVLVGPAIFKAAEDGDGWWEIAGATVEERRDFSTPEYRLRAATRRVASICGEDAAAAYAYWNRLGGEDTEMNSETNSFDEAEPAEEQQWAAPSAADELTNYQLVIEEKWRVFGLLNEARAASNRRLMTCIGASVGLLIMLALVRPASVSWLLLLHGALAAGWGAVVIAVAADGLKSKFWGPGSNDWKKVHATNISKTTLGCQRQILADLLEAVRVGFEGNKQKANTADLVTRLLWGQLLIMATYWLSASVVGVN